MFDADHFIEAAAKSLFDWTVQRQRDQPIANRVFASAEITAHRQKTSDDVCGSSDDRLFQSWRGHHASAACD